MSEKTKQAVLYDKWLSSKGGGEEVAFAVLEVLIGQGYKVAFVYGNKIEEADLAGLKKEYPEVTFTQIWNDEEALKMLTKGKDLFINVSFMDYSYGHARKNVYYVHFPSKIRSGLFNHVLYFFQESGLYMTLPVFLKEPIQDRLRAGIYKDMHRRLDSYQLILANSEFTQKWIRKYWGKESIVLYPPVKLIEGKIQKNNWICSVGRFFTLAHGKKQEVLIEAFKKLHNQGYKDWELHLVGGLGSEPSSLRFMEMLKEQAKGYPVIFHTNAERKEVEDVLLKSKIYWHAAGYGENPDKDPVKFEHFGIAPVEAISAGCIPVLYEGGGLREIIEKLSLPVNEHMFTTVDELVKKTTKIIDENQQALPDGIHSKLHKVFFHEHFMNEFLKLLSI